MSKKMREQINKVKNWKPFLNENKNDEKTILIRSKIDKSFRFDITYKDDKIIKTEIQGDNQDKMNDESWLNLIINVNVGKELDYNKLRSILSELPELYVKDIQ